MRKLNMSYTAEIEKELRAIYTAATNEQERADAMELLAKRFDKTIPSIRAKLVLMKIYIKPAKNQRTKSKGELVTVIAAICGEQEEVLFDSLEKTTKYVLTSIIKTFANAQKRIQNLEEEIVKLQITEDDAAAETA